MRHHRILAVTIALSSCLPLAAWAGGGDAKQDVQQIRAAATLGAAIRIIRGMPAVRAKVAKSDGLYLATHTKEVPFGHAMIDWAMDSRPQPLKMNRALTMTGPTCRIGLWVNDLMLTAGAMDDEFSQVPRRLNVEVFADGSNRDAADEASVLKELPRLTQGALADRIQKLLEE